MAPAVAGHTGIGGGRGIPPPLTQEGRKASAGHLGIPDKSYWLAGKGRCVRVSCFLPKVVSGLQRQEGAQVAFCCCSMRRSSQPLFPPLF